MNNKKVVVGMSGGVDSSVAAAILLEQGCDVIGVTMSIWDDSYELNPGKSHGCYGPEEKDEIEAAEAIARHLGIKHYTIDLRKEYNEHIIQYFKQEYLAGRTPNPCVKCNAMMKFGFMLEKLREMSVDYDFFATGHYAQVRLENGTFVICRAQDEKKDQTYFLQGLDRNLIRKIIFPLGSLKKEEVRMLAKKYNLHSAETPESQDFISGGDYSAIFSKNDVPSGDIVDEQGNILGKHRGIIHYTVGQRKGLGISSKMPKFVKNIDAQNNRIVVSDEDALFARGLKGVSLNILADQAAAPVFEAFVKIRQQHKGVLARISVYDDTSFDVEFKEPQRAVTPGQAVALYDRDILLGGGIIEKAILE